MCITKCVYEVATANRPYSKVNKSTGATVTVIFSHFCFILFVLWQKSKHEFATTQKATALNWK
jgi:hypothetical protein